MGYKEYLVKRKKGAKEILLSVLIYIAAFILSLACIMFLPAMAGVELLLSVGFLYGGYWLSSKFNREFEYIITEDSVDVDVIFNASQRKRLISFSMKEVDMIAPVNGDEYAAFSKGDYKEIDATTHRKDANVYFAAVEKNGKFVVKFEPPVTALQELRKYAPSKVVITQ